MDIGNLVSQENANEGVWFQAVVYGKKQQFDMKILGSDSDKVKEFEREQFRKLNLSKKNIKNETFSDDVIDDVLDSIDEKAIIRIAGIRSRDKDPLAINGIELKSDKASYSLLLKKIPELKDFIMDKSEERTNFLSDRKKN